MQGETGANPVRARRREAYIAKLYTKVLLVYPDATVWRKPLGKPEKVDE